MHAPNIEFSFRGVQAREIRGHPELDLGNHMKKLSRSISEAAESKTQVIECY